MQVAEQLRQAAKTWTSRGRGVQKVLREIEKFSDTDQRFRDGQKEKWKEELQEIQKKLEERASA